MNLREYAKNLILDGHVWLLDGRCEVISEESIDKVFSLIRTQLLDALPKEQEKDNQLFGAQYAAIHSRREGYNKALSDCRTAIEEVLK